MENRRLEVGVAACRQLSVATWDRDVQYWIDGVSLSREGGHMISRRLNALGTAMLASLAMGLLAAAPATASIEVVPSLAAHDPISSLANPAYGRPDHAAALDETARQDGDALTQRAAQDSGGVEEIDKSERDCAKTALGELGWDIWWAITEGQSFDLESTATHVIELCLNARIPGQVNVPATASVYAGMITSDAENVYQQEERDIYGVADWMLYADYWHVEE
jgi:hypothetical protein